jgi:hypothetical protein
MTHEEVAVKARGLMKPVLGAAACNSLIERVLGLEETKDIRERRPLISAKSSENVRVGPARKVE